MHTRLFQDFKGELWTKDNLLQRCRYPEQWLHKEPRVLRKIEPFIVLDCGQESYLISGFTHLPHVNRRQGLPVFRLAAQTKVDALDVIRQQLGMYYRQVDICEIYEELGFFPLDEQFVLLVQQNFSHSLLDLLLEEQYSNLKIQSSRRLTAKKIGEALYKMCVKGYFDTNHWRRLLLPDRTNNENQSPIDWMDILATPKGQQLIQQLLIFFVMAYLEFEKYSQQQATEINSALTIQVVRFLALIFPVCHLDYMARTQEVDTDSAISYEQAHFVACLEAFYPLYGELFLQEQHIRTPDTLVKHIKPFIE